MGYFWRARHTAGIREVKRIPSIFTNLVISKLMTN